MFPVSGGRRTIHPTDVQCLFSSSSHNKQVRSSLCVSRVYCCVCVFKKSKQCWCDRKFGYMFPVSGGRKTIHPTDVQCLFSSSFLTRQQHDATHSPKQIHQYTKQQLGNKFKKKKRATHPEGGGQGTNTQCTHIQM
jgi:hypothetical protein